MLGTYNKISDTINLIGFYPVIRKDIYKERRSICSGDPLHRTH